MRVRFSTDSDEHTRGIVRMISFSNNPEDLKHRLPRVRRAHPDEGEDLTRLAIRSKASRGYDAEFMAAALPDLQVETEWIGAGRVFVVEQTGALLGFCSLEIGARDSASAELTQLFVEPDHMGRNFGRLLWNYALRELRRDHPEVRRLFVVSDPDAVGFYEKCGARRDGYEASIVDAKRLLPRLVYEIPSKSTRQ